MNQDKLGNAIFCYHELRSLGLIDFYFIIPKEDYTVTHYDGSILSPISLATNSSKDIETYNALMTETIKLKNKYYDLFKMLSERKAKIYLCNKDLDKISYETICDYTINDLNGKRTKNPFLFINHGTDLEIKLDNDLIFLIESVTTDLGRKISEAFDNITELENNINDIKNSLTNLNERINNHDNDISKIKTDINNIDSKINSIESKNSNRDTKIANLEENISNLVIDNTYMIKFLAGFNTTDTITITKNSTVQVTLSPCATVEHQNIIPWNDLTLIGVRDVFLGGSSKLVASRYYFNDQKHPVVTIFNTNDNDVTIRKCDCGIYTTFAKNGGIHWFDDEKILVPDK